MLVTLGTLRVKNPPLTVSLHPFSYQSVTRQPCITNYSITQIYHDSTLYYRKQVCIKKTEIPGILKLEGSVRMKQLSNLVVICLYTYVTLLKPQNPNTNSQD